MYPGLSDADCQVAELHYRQLVNAGQRQQFVAVVRPASSATRAVAGSVRRKVGAFLVCAGQRLQGVQAVSGERLVPTPTGKMSAIA